MNQTFKVKKPAERAAIARMLRTPHPNPLPMGEGINLVADASGTDSIFHLPALRRPPDP